MILKDKNMNCKLTKIIEIKEPDFDLLASKYRIFKCKESSSGNIDNVYLGVIPSKNILGSVYFNKAYYMLINNKDSLENKAIEQEIINKFKQAKGSQYYTREFYSGKNYFKNLYKISLRSFYQLLLNCCFKVENSYISNKLYYSLFKEEDKHARQVNKISFTDNSCIKITTHYFTKYHVFKEREECYKKKKYFFETTKGKEYAYLTRKKDEESLDNSYIKKAPYHNDKPDIYTLSENAFKWKISKTKAFYDYYNQFINIYGDCIFIKQQELKDIVVETKYGNGEISKEVERRIFEEFDKNKINIIFSSDINRYMHISQDINLKVNKKMLSLKLEESTSVKEDEYNIIVTKDKNYYKEKRIDDPYITQRSWNISLLTDKTFNKVIDAGVEMNHILRRVLIEFIIKKDIYTKIVTMFKNKDEMENIKYFILFKREINNDYYSSAIIMRTDNFPKIEFENFNFFAGVSSKMLSEDEENLLINYYEDINIEGLIILNDATKVEIYRTDIRAIADAEAFKKNIQLLQSTNKVTYKELATEIKSLKPDYKNELESIIYETLKNCFEEKTALDEVDGRKIYIDLTKLLKRKGYSIQKITHNNYFKFIKNYLEDNYNVTLRKSLSKDKKTLDEILGGSYGVCYKKEYKDIIHNNGKTIVKNYDYIYWVGEGQQTKKIYEQRCFSVIRGIKIIKAEENSSFNIKNFIKLITEVDFVRDAGQRSVLPWAFKYLREYEDLSQCTKWKDKIII